MKILLTFTGFHDPYAVGLIGQEEQPGPILSLVNARAFDQVILFSTPNAEKNTIATEKALRSLHPDLKVEVRDLSLPDPTDYLAILKGLRAPLRDICEAAPQAQFFIAVALGRRRCTPVGCYLPPVARSLRGFCMFVRRGL